MTWNGTSAPGKALLSGEYAVLEGAPAIVAAVERRVRASWTQEADRPLGPEVTATLERAVGRVGPCPGSVDIDVADLYEGEIKLGLGSSAAASVAAAGAVFDHHGQDIGSHAVRDEIFECAFEGHAVVAPSGSGVDVAASTYGGFLRFSRDAGVPTYSSIAPPHDLTFNLVWTGHAARTSELIEAVHGLRERDPDSYRARSNALVEGAVRFADAFERGSANVVIAEADRYGEAMRALGNDANAPIVDEALSQAIELARAHGGAAKPSGAGGGDVAVAFFSNPSDSLTFDESCRDAGLQPIDVTWGAKGVRRGR